MKALAAVAAVVMAVVAPRPARACSVFGYAPMTLGDSGDTVAPTLRVTGATVWRGDGSCEGTGIVTLEVEAADDRGTVGFLVRVTRPGAVAFPGLPATPFTQMVTDPALHFIDEGQPVDLTFEVRAVDLDGNLSAPVSVDVLDVPPDEGGCAVGGGTGAGWLAALALLPLARQIGRAHV